VIYPSFRSLPSDFEDQAQHSAPFPLRGPCQSLDWPSNFPKSIHKLVINALGSWIAACVENEQILIWENQVRTETNVSFQGCLPKFIKISDVSFISRPASTSGPPLRQPFQWILRYYTVLGFQESPRYEKCIKFVKM
jgi:hypothetical protein